MAKCRDCKYFDMSEPTRSGLGACTNTNRKRYSKWGGNATCSELKAPWRDACRTGFEPREEGERNE